MSQAVHVVIAVKRLDQAKSRLAEQFTPTQRAQLALAMLSDTLRAAGAADGVASLTVVTPGVDTVADVARAQGAEVLAEPDGAGLNGALRHAATRLRERHGPVVVAALQADLPALRPAELTAALAARPPHGTALIVDHLGVGSAALITPAQVTMNPLFGPDSAQRHQEAGAVALQGDWPGLRLDVDTVSDLTNAVSLGAGPATRAVLHGAVSAR